MGQFKEWEYNSSGYVFIDLPDWSVVPTRGTSYVEFLAQRCGGNIQALNDTYGTRAESFPALLTSDMTTLNARHAEVAADDEVFLNVLADAYYTCVVRELRTVDPHHLILGDRLMALPERTPDSILFTASKFVDVLSFQPMGTRTMPRDYIDRVFQLTGKPILLADAHSGNKDIAGSPTND